MKATVIIKNFENESTHSVFADTWIGLEDKVYDFIEYINKGLSIFDRYKISSTVYYDDDGDEYDIYLREKVKH